MDMNVKPHPLLREPRKRALIQALEKGLPLAAEPYALLAQQLDMTEAEVIHEIRALQEAGIIKRMGVVVRHRQLGYTANAMVVWNVPDTQVAEVGCFLGSLPFVTLSYRRPRRLPQWPYNLFTMIHGSSREQVLSSIQAMVQTYALHHFEYDILFSKTCYKQRGARYVAESSRDEARK